MKTLLINAHPDFANTAHFSNRLEQHFVTKFKENFPSDDLTIVNLYDMEIPRIAQGELLISIWEKESAGLPLTADESFIASKSANLLQQFKDFQRIVIATPLHNFNITSQLKDYLDNILIARETFRYLAAPEENGKVSEGLMTDDRRVLLLFASGSIYTADNYYTHLDFAPRYLKAIFVDVMGFDSFDVVRAEGTSVIPVDEAAILSAADRQLTDAFASFYAE